LQGCAPKNGHMLNYSGPVLLPPEDNLEENLKEHERQVQQAVRKARLVKENKKADSENGQTESLFHFHLVRSGK